MEVDVSVGDQQSSRNSRKGHEPIGIAKAKVGRAGPDIPLIVSYVPEELEAELIFCGPI